MPTADPCIGLRELDGNEADGFAHSHLSEKWVDSTRWRVGYECPTTGRRWLRDSPRGELQGGGPPRLRQLDEEAHKYIRLGNGPSASGGGHAWHMQVHLFARCVRCGAFMSLDPSEYASCLCGAMHKDVDAGRFGSSLGDEAIEIFRRT